MERRITGTEMEWGLLIQNVPRQDFHPVEKLTGVVEETTTEELRRMGTFLSNGSRYYLDIGTHPEYATPEDDSIEGTIANELAGERIVYEGFEKARLEGKFHDFRLNKRLIDDNGITWGHHESFSAKSGPVQIHPESLALLGLHLATVNIFTGAGIILRNSQGKGRFSIAQKVHSLTKDFSDSTTGNNKPLVNLRPEHHADANKYLRVHVTSGDANMSPWAMRMRLGSISLVLLLTEHGYTPRISLQMPLHQVAKKTANDISLKGRIELADGKKFTALDIQGEIISAVKDLADKKQLTSDETTSLKLWEDAYNDLAKDPDLLLDRSDWLAKKRYLEKFMDRRGLNWEDPKVLRREKQWDDISPHGFAVKLRETLWSPWMPPEELISRRHLTPPETTRATLRGRYITQFANSAHDSTVEWSFIKHDGIEFKLRDPFATTHPSIDRLVAA